ncbi:hypothetical protein SNEBB_009669 [Seison nebaliae]|nr:hypothetical protein SNEBB_009669 [Seison nebaliae]
MGEKTDMERIGLFKEMTYTNIGTEYKTASTKFNESAYKGRQMLSENSKYKTGNQDGYFNKQFDRMFTGEAYSDPIRQRRLDRIKNKQKNLNNKPFYTFSGEKKPSGAGSHYGTFSGPIEFFKQDKRTLAPDPRLKGKNFQTNPAKKGTGYGYPHLGLEKDPNYLSGVQTNKNRGGEEGKDKGKVFLVGMHPNNFFQDNPYPNQSDGATYREKKKVEDNPLQKKVFVPAAPGKKLGLGKYGGFAAYPQADKSGYTPLHVPLRRPPYKGKPFIRNEYYPRYYPIRSPMNYNLKRSINSHNWKCATQYTSIIKGISHKGEKCKEIF